MPLLHSPAVDFRNPNYDAVFTNRLRMLEALDRDARQGGSMVADMHAVYRECPGQFIVDWGITVDPRNVGSPRPVMMPFILFPKQVEFIDFLDERLGAASHGSGDGILVKSRDCGASWLAMSYGITLCLFNQNITVGFGSAKEDNVDRSGDPKCLFYKGRQFLRYIPRHFRGPWDHKKHTAHMRIEIPHTEGAITGEAGDNMGVGGRYTIYFADEAALQERPQLIDASLSNVTRCRIEMSSVRGIDNVFAQRARGGLIKRFDFHYRNDPRKVNITGVTQIVQDVDPDTREVNAVHVAPGQKYPDFERFYNKMDEMVRNQELECDFLASIVGGVIEAAHIAAAIGAAERLEVTPSGEWLASYDIADLGTDKNAVTIRHGCAVKHVEEWSGSNINPMLSIRRAFEIADKYNCRAMVYDASGMGGTWHGYFTLANDERVTNHQKPIEMRKFQGGGKVMFPEAKAPGTDRRNEDYFENLKAQSWMTLRQRFVETYKALHGEQYDPEGIISLPVGHPLMDKLTSELAQPTRTWSKNGKLMIDKVPDGVASPNIADSLMQAFGVSRRPMVINPALLELANDPNQWDRPGN